MADIEKLRDYLKQDTSVQDKILYIMHFIGEPTTVKDIKKFAADNGYRSIKDKNLSAILTKMGRFVTRTALGWELTITGKGQIAKVHASQPTPTTVASKSLQGEIIKIKSEETKAFALETLACLEHKLYRSAIVMSWLAAVSILQNTVVNKHLIDFNRQASTSDPNFKPCKNSDDISARLKEAQFLDILVSISVISKNVKAELKTCLDRRNGCGHPNSYKVSEAITAHHLEVLILNVFQPFA